MITRRTFRNAARGPFAALLVVAALAWSGSNAAAQGPATGAPPLPTYLPFPERAANAGGPVAVPVHEVASMHMLAAPATPPEPKSALRPLAEVVIDTRLPGDGALPTDTATKIHAPAAVGGQWLDNRPWMTYEFAWHASGLAHRPSYFEDLNLERYGNSVCPSLQPAISAARFFASVPMLPYNMTVHRPGECIFMLGYCRPGSRAPNLAYRPPLQLSAAAVEAAAITGAVFIIP